MHGRAAPIKPDCWHGSITSPAMLDDDAHHLTAVTHNLRLVATQGLVQATGMQYRLYPRLNFTKRRPCSVVSCASESCRPPQTSTAPAPPRRPPACCWPASLASCWARWSHWLHCSCLQSTAVDVSEEVRGWRGLCPMQMNAHVPLHMSMGSCHRTNAAHGSCQHATVPVVLVIERKLIGNSSCYSNTIQPPHAAFNTA